MISTVYNNNSYIKIVFKVMMHVINLYNTNLMENSSDIISRLKFIGCIKTGEKINTRHMYVQPDGICTKISRTFIFHDNRNNTLSFIKDTINRSFELLTLFERSTKDSDRVLCINLVNDLHNAQKGLIHLKNTYIDDTMFKCFMETLLQSIDIKLSDIDSRYKTKNIQLTDIYQTGGGSSSGCGIAVGNSNGGGESNGG